MLAHLKIAEIYLQYLQLFASLKNSHLQGQELLAKSIKVGGWKLVAAAYDDAEYHCSKEELEMRTHSRFLGSREGGGGQIHIIGQERLLLRISHPLLCYSRAWTPAFLFWFPELAQPMSLPGVMAP